MATDLAAERRAENPPPATKRVRFTETRELYVDLPADRADEVLAMDDITDLADEYGQLRRIAHGRLQVHSEGDLSVEDATGGVDPLVQPLDGTGRQSYLWTARNAVSDARYELSSGRYREGNCPELDAANAELGVLEERLRVMALAAEGLGPDCLPLPADE